LAPVSLTFLFLLASCLPKNAEEGQTSNAHFITLDNKTVGLVAKVKNPEINICLSGEVNDFQEWEANIKDAVSKWVKPLQSVTGDSLAQRVNVHNGQQLRICDADVVVRVNTHSNARVGSYPIIRMSPEGYFGSFNVLLHEFGHAFGLSDTYYNGKSGQCQPGQPQAVMCNTSFSDLQRDDIAGVETIYRRAFPQDRGSSGNSVESQQGKRDFFVALGEPGEGGRSHVYLSLGTPDSRANVSLCSGDSAQCSQLASPGIGTWQPISLLPGTNFYRTEQTISIQNQSSLTFRVLANGQTSSRSIRLVER
jgi:hypothetical protein